MVVGQKHSMEVGSMMYVLWVSLLIFSTITNEAACQDFELLHCNSTVNGSTTSPETTVQNPRNPTNVNTNVNTHTYELAQFSEETEMIFSTCNFADFDTYLSVFDSNGRLRCENDDGCNDWTSRHSLSLRSKLACRVPPNTSNWTLRVGGFRGDSGNYQLKTTCTTARKSIPVQCGDSKSGTTVNQPPYYHLGPNGTMLFEIDLPNRTTLELSTCITNTNFDTFLIVGDENGTYFCSNDDFCGNQSKLDCELSRGSYLVMVGGRNGEEGNFTLDITCPKAREPIAMSCGDTVTGTTIGKRPLSDMRAGAMLYSIDIKEDTKLVASTCGRAEFDTFLIVADENMAWLCGNDDTDCGLQSEAECELAPGQYFIALSGIGRSEGDFGMEVSCFRHVPYGNGTGWPWWAWLLIGVAISMGIVASFALYNFVLQRRMSDIPLGDLSYVLQNDNTEDLRL